MTTPAQGMEFFRFKTMETINLRNKNGYGYAIIPPSEYTSEPELYFETDAERVFDSVLAHGNCLVEGTVGAGKTHLLEDVHNLIRWGSPAVATMLFSVHKNVGTKKGVKRALDAFEGFINDTGDEGVIILDNIDMYGYSNSKARRQYTLAKEHTQVAAYLEEVIKDDTDTPLVIGTSHDERWRNQHWRYPEKKGDNDEVTPVALSLLSSFAIKYTFDGKLEPNKIARILTSQKSFDDAEAQEVIAVLESQPENCIHRVVTRLEREVVAQVGIEESVSRINHDTERLVQGISLSRTDQSSLL